MIAAVEVCIDKIELKEPSSPSTIDVFSVFSLAPYDPL